MTALLLVAFLSATPAATAEADFEAACARFEAGDYEGAARGYEALLAAGHESAPVLYDLGNARFRQGKLGWAITAWERALSLAPADRDTRRNLRMARALAFDRQLAAVGPGEEPFLDRLLTRAPRALFALPLVAAWWAFWFSLALRRGRHRRLLTAVALASGAVVLACGAMLAAQMRLERTPAAIVVAPGSAVRAAPSRALRPAFELREGTKVRVLGSSGAYARVRLPGGLEGWVARDELAVL